MDPYKHIPAEILSAPTIISLLGDIQARLILNPDDEHKQIMHIESSLASSPRSTQPHNVSRSPSSMLSSFNQVSCSLQPDDHALSSPSLMHADSLLAQTCRPYVLPYSPSALPTPTSPIHFDDVSCSSDCTDVKQVSQPVCSPSAACLPHQSFRWEPQDGPNLGQAGFSNRLSVSTQMQVATPAPNVGASVLNPGSEELRQGALALSDSSTPAVQGEESSSRTGPHQYSITVDNVDCSQTSSELLTLDIAPPHRKDGWSAPNATLMPLQLQAKPGNLRGRAHQHGSTETLSSEAPLPQPGQTREPSKEEFVLPHVELQTALPECISPLSHSVLSHNSRRRQQPESDGHDDCVVQHDDLLNALNDRVVQHTLDADTDDLQRAVAACEALHTLQCAGAVQKLCMSKPVLLWTRSENTMAMQDALWSQRALFAPMIPAIRVT